MQLYSPLPLSTKHHVIDGQGIRNKMETKEAGIGVRGVERLEAVAEVMLHSERRQPAGLILEIKRYHQPCQSYSFLTAQILSN